MTRYVIDAPTLVHIVSNDLPVDAAHQLVAPNHVRSQAMTLLLQAVRRGETTEHDALERHERLTGLKMRLLGDRGSRGMAWRIAREHDWDTTDVAEYLAVTRLQADAFVTVDPEMAAMATGVVPIAPLEALGTATD